jgi:hypothetical protein
MLKVELLLNLKPPKLETSGKKKITLLKVPNKIFKALDSKIGTMTLSTMTLLRKHHFSVSCVIILTVVKLCIFMLSVVLTVILQTPVMVCDIMSSAVI